MPKKQGGEKKKAKEEAKKQKAAEKKNRPKVDPTFGLKNKKGKKKSRICSQQCAQHERR